MAFNPFGPRRAFDPSAAFLDATRDSIAGRMTGQSAQNWFPTTPGFSDESGNDYFDSRNYASYNDMYNSIADRIGGGIGVPLTDAQRSVLGRDAAGFLQASDLQQMGQGQIPGMNGNGAPVNNLTALNHFLPGYFSGQGVTGSVYGAGQPNPFALYDQMNAQSDAAAASGNNALWSQINNPGTVNALKDYGLRNLGGAAASVFNRAMGQVDSAGRTAGVGTGYFGDSAFALPPAAPAPVDVAPPIAAPPPALPAPAPAAPPVYHEPAPALPAPAPYHDPNPYHPGAADPRPGDESYNPYEDPNSPYYGNHPSPFVTGPSGPATPFDNVPQYGTGEWWMWYSNLPPALKEQYRAMNPQLFGGG